MQATGIQISPVNMEERRKIDIRAGDTVRVWVKVKEKEKIRRQPFEGVVLARKHGKEAGATFTVRRVSGGYGIEKIFPLYSPAVDKIEIIKRARTRRAKLYYVREKAAREIRRQMRRMRTMGLSTTSDIDEKAASEAEKETEASPETEVEEERKEETVDSE